MRRYLARRIGLSAVVLFALSLVTFGAVRLMPGDPALAFLSSNSSPEAINQIREQLGLDRPAWVQYGEWIGNFLKGDFGTSLTSPSDIFTEILNRYPVSLQLALMSLILAMVVGIPAGILAAVRPGGRIDTLVQTTSFLFLSIAPFILGALMIAVNSATVQMRISGYVPFTENPFLSLQLLAAPAIALALPVAANFARYTRVSMIESLSLPFIRTARSKGASMKRRVLRHGLRNGLIPVVTIVGLDLGTLIGGTIVVETVFSLPGMGTMLINAINTSDYPTVQACVMAIGATYVAINLVIDLLYPVIDPRVRSV